MKEALCKTPCKHFEASSNYCLLHEEFLKKYPHGKWSERECDDFGGAAEEERPQEPISKGEEG